MTTLWVAHRRDEERAWLCELPPQGARVIGGLPRLEAFQGAPEPQGIVLGVEESCAEELRFANELCERFPRARWWLAGEPHERALATRLFDCLPHRFLDLSADSAELRTSFEGGAFGDAGESLSKLRQRTALSERFRERFADLDPSVFLPLINPRTSDRPVLISGETGLGRRVLARYIHRFTEEAPGPYLEVDGREIGQIEALWQRLKNAEAEPGDALLCAALVHAEALPDHVQDALAGELELGQLPGALPRVRLLALSGGDGRNIAPDLRQRFELHVAIPPLRERPRAVENFTRAWATTRGLSDDPRLGDWIDALARRRLRRNYRDLERLLERALESNDAPSPESPKREAGSPPAEAAALGDSRGQPPGERAPRGVLSPASEFADTPPASGPLGLRAVSHALAHELRNPLSTLRTFTELFPEQHEDEEFRVNFGALASRDVVRMTETMELLDAYDVLEEGPTETLDLAKLAEGVVREFRDVFDARKLAVLEELELGTTAVRGQPAALRFALTALTRQIVDWVDDGRDLYVSVRRVAARGDEPPAVRLLMRFPGISDRIQSGALSEARASLAITLAEAIFSESGGQLTLDTETDLGLLAIDLPAH